MAETIDIRSDEDIIKEIREKIKNNPKYINPCGKEFQEDIKRYKFENGNKFISWMQQNGILRSPADANNDWAKKRGYKNYTDYFSCLIQKKGYKNLTDHKNRLAQKKGYKDLNDYRNRLAQKKGYKNLTDYLNHLAQEKGYKNLSDYHNHLAKERGYENHSEYSKILEWSKGSCSPMFENKDCSSYLGICVVEEKIARTVLQMIFEYVEKMPINNPGFDFTCKSPRQEFIYKYPQFKLERNKEYKIDAKSTTVDIQDKLHFAIMYNNVSDYFLLVGFNNRDSLDISGIWLIKSDEQIRINRGPWSKVDLWNRRTFTITNRSEYLFEFHQYELICKLEKLKEGIEQIRSDILDEPKESGATSRNV